MRYVILALVAALVGCGEKQPPRRPGEDYLKDIVVEGNQKLDDDDLVSGLALKRTQRRGRPPDPYLIQVDADRIRGEYVRKGFLGIDVRSRVEREGDAATVIYSVDEGIRATTRIVIKGLPGDVPEQRVREQLRLEDGDPFDYATYDKAKPMLLAVVEDAGYARAKLKPTVFADRANRVAIIELDYDAGPKSRFGTITVTGADGDLAEAVRERLQFATGDVYSTNAIAATQRQLYAMQRFSTVQVLADDDADDPIVDVKVAVAQAAQHEVKLGGGTGLDPTGYEVRGRAGYSVAGFPTQMDTFSADLRPAYGSLSNGGGWEPRVRALARIDRQDIFWTYSRGEVEAGYNYLAVEAYTSYGPRAGLGFGTPVGHERVQLRLGWGLERLTFRNISPLIDDALRTELQIDESNVIGAYSQAVSIDLRDNPLDTHRGLYGEIHIAEGTRFAGGNFDYFEIVPELRGFLPIGDVVLAGKARAGTFYGDAPPTERFFAGGASSNRGFGERELSPFVRDGDTTVPYGGTSRVETSIEARIPITTWRKMGVGTVVFLDGANVTNDTLEADLGNLYWAAGAGMRLNTIVGPVRFDVGYRLNHTDTETDPAPGSRFAFHFNIGEAF